MRISAIFPTLVRSAWALRCGRVRPCMVASSPDVRGSECRPKVRFIIFDAESESSVSALPFSGVVRAAEASALRKLRYSDSAPHPPSLTSRSQCQGGREAASPTPAVDRRSLVDGVRRGCPTQCPVCLQAGGAPPPQEGHAIGGSPSIGYGFLLSSLLGWVNIGSWGVLASPIDS